MGGGGGGVGGVGGGGGGGVGVGGGGMLAFIESSLMIICSGSPFSYSPFSTTP